MLALIRTYILYLTLPMTPYVDPCLDVFNIELAIGCSTVNGYRAYSEATLIDIAKFSEGKL